MKRGQLYAQALPDAVTLYWRKPKNAPIQAEYDIFLDDQRVGSAYRTHFTLEHLEADQVCQLEVKLDGQSLGAIRTRTRPAFHRLDVRGFGVFGDGNTMDTAALQKAIDACGPEDEVYLPAGVYRTGALRLHSDMALHLDEGAVLQGTDRPEDYLPRIHSRFEGIEQECYSSLLNLGELDHASGPNCRNVLIYGRGIISSGGQVLARRIIELERERLRDYLSENAELVASCENDHTIPGRVRPRLINLSNCENVRITGLTLKNGASWNVHMIYSRDIVTDHCTFISEGVWNGDGWDPDSSERCILFGCRFRTGDDCVAIKSGKNPEGNRIARPSKAIRVFDCSCGLGRGVCVGSEISGGVEDVKIWDCDLTRSLFGLQIKGTKKRGGYVRNIEVTDCTLPRVSVHAVSYNDDGVPADSPPVFQGFRFERLRFTGQALDHAGGWSEVPPIELVGFDVPGYEMRDVTVRGCVLPSDGQPVILRHCANISMERLDCDTEHQPDISANGKEQEYGTNGH